METCVYYVIGGPHISEQTGLNSGPLIQNLFIVTLYTLFVRIDKYISDSDSDYVVD